MPFAELKARIWDGVAVCAVRRSLMRLKTVLIVLAVLVLALANGRKVSSFDNLPTNLMALVRRLCSNWWS